MNKSSTHNDVDCADHKINHTDINSTSSKQYCFIDVDKLHKNLQINEKAARTICITNVEEKYQQKRFNKSKYTAYTLACEPPIVDGVDICVARRYNDFKWLRNIFVQCFPSIYIPPIPPKQILGRFEKAFVVQRKKDLERFLNRISRIKPLAESLIFTVFLSRPQDTFNVSKEEIERNHVPTLKDRIHFLCKSFPDLTIIDKFISQYIDANYIDIHKDTRALKFDDRIMEYKQSADDFIFGSEIKECNEFVNKICEKMNSLCDITRKLDEKMLKLKQSTQKFHEAFWGLHTTTNQLRSSCILPKDKQLSLFGNDKRDFYGWYHYNNTEYEVNHNFFWVHLKYQYEDIHAFMDLFKNRDRLISEFQAITARNKTWRSLIEGEYELQPHQITQIQMDYKMERLLRYLLLINTKVIMNYNVYKIWNELIDDWQNMIFRYAQSQILTHQFLHAECYLDDFENSSSEHNVEPKQDTNVESNENINLDDSL